MAWPCVRHLRVSSTYDRVRQTVVHPSKAVDDDHQDKQSIRREAHQGPGVDEDERPPLEDEDDDEDQHHPCRVAVSVCLRILEARFLGSPQLDQDPSICRGNRSEHEDLNHGRELCIGLPSSGSHINETA